jgi:hypothetical protein
VPNPVDGSPPDDLCTGDLTGREIGRRDLINTASYERGITVFICRATCGYVAVQVRECGE